MRGSRGVLFGLLLFSLLPVPLSLAQVPPRRVAILEFRNLAGDRAFSWLSEAVPETLTTKLAAVRALSLIERRQVEKVIKEQRFQLTDLVDPSTAVRVGRLTGAQVVVLGSFARMGRDVLFNLRFVDVETGVVLHAAQVQAETSSGSTLFAGLNRLADASIEALEKRVVVKGPEKEVVRASLPVKPEERKRLEAPPARSLDAYALYGKALKEQKEGRWREAAALFERATEKDAAFADAFNDLGVVRSDLGRMEGAKEAYARALALYREKGDEAGAARTLNNMGIIHRVQGRYAEAMRLFQESLTIFRHLGNEAGTARTLGNMANIHQSQGRYAEAMRLYEESLATFRQLGDEAGAAQTLNNMGIIHRVQGRYAEAMRLYEESLAIKRRLGDEADAALTLNNMGLIHTSQGRYAEAMRLHEESLAIARRLGDEAGAARTLNNMGIIHRVQGRYAEAMRLYEQSLAIERRLGDEAGAAGTLNNMGLIHEHQGRYAEAMRLYCEALSISRRLGLAPYVSQIQENIRIVQSRRPDLSCAK